MSVHISILALIIARKELDAKKSKFIKCVENIEFNKEGKKCLVILWSGNHSQKYFQLKTLQSFSVRSQIFSSNQLYKNKN